MGLYQVPQTAGDPSKNVAQVQQALQQTAALQQQMQLREQEMDLSVQKAAQYGEALDFTQNLQTDRLDWEQEHDKMVIGQRHDEMWARFMSDADNQDVIQHLSESGQLEQMRNMNPSEPGFMEMVGGARGEMQVSREQDAVADIMRRAGALPDIDEAVIQEQLQNGVPLQGIVEDIRAAEKRDRAPRVAKRGAQRWMTKKTGQFELLKSDLSPDVAMEVEGLFDDYEEIEDPMDRQQIRDRLNELIPSVEYQKKQADQIAELQQRERAMLTQLAAMKAGVKMAGMASAGIGSATPSEARAEEPAGDTMTVGEMFPTPMARSGRSHTGGPVGSLANEERTPKGYLKNKKAKALVEGLMPDFRAYVESGDLETFQAAIGAKGLASDEILDGMFAELYKKEGTESADRLAEEQKFERKLQHIRARQKAGLIDVQQAQAEEAKLRRKSNRPPADDPHRRPRR